MEICTYTKNGKSGIGNRKEIKGLAQVDRKVFNFRVIRGT